MKKVLNYILPLLLFVTLFGCKEKSLVEVLEGEVVLYPSVGYVEAGSDSFVEFSATCAEVAVSDFEVYLKTSDGSQRVEKNRFNATKSGNYTFYAVYNSTLSEEVVVKCISELPAKGGDSSPEKYNSFRKRVLGTLATGTWCPNCPFMIAAVHDYEEKYGANDDVVMTEVHSGGDDVMRCEASDKIAKRLSVIAYPILKFQMSGKSGNAMYNNGSKTAEDVKAIVDKNLQSEALTAISANSVLNGSTLSIRADIKIAQKGQFKVGAWIVEDGIEAYQSDALADYMHTHNDAVCGAYPLNFSMCEFVGGAEVQQANTTHMFYCEFDLKTLPTLQKIENCEIVVFVYNDDNLVKSVDNVIKFAVGESFDVEYK